MGVEQLESCNRIESLSVEVPKNIDPDLVGSFLVIQSRSGRIEEARMLTKNHFSPTLYDHFGRYYFRGVQQLGIFNILEFWSV
jgi:hypothetical protein